MLTTEHYAWYSIQFEIRTRNDNTFRIYETTKAPQLIQGGHTHTIIYVSKASASSL